MISDGALRAYHDIALHRHTHGEHVHEHEHGGSSPDHEHGWHSPAEHCGGDDTFGWDATFPREAALVGAELAGQWHEQAALVVVPYVPSMIHPAVLEAVAGQNVVLQNVSSTQWDYWALVAELWAAGEDFIIVEHDTLPPPGFVEGFDACPEPWCVHDYRIAGVLIREKYGGEGGAFGCVRFRAELMAAHPGLLEGIVDRHWSHLDYLVATGLRGLGLVGHRHEPEATHLHKYGPKSDAEVVCKS